MMTTATPGNSGLAESAILIVDDCALYREALAAVLRMNGVSPVGLAWDLASLIGALESTAPQIVLLNMTSRNLETLLRAAKSLGRGAPIVAIGAIEDDEPGILACAEVGVVAFHMRSDTLADLLLMISAALEGRSSVPPQLSAVLLRRVSALAAQRKSTVSGPVLTTRESQILDMLELGQSNQDIAMQLSIAVHTVKNHVHSLLTKLGVSSRAEAAALSHALRGDRDPHRGPRSRSRRNWL
ncbi:LuxR C-terminal-related transcriptional regulator [Mycolicibacterium austroafricanum]|uniref:LuxR C-terminal-related transcriptional regulator n=1 Tax=Mycolicibacterium austroafricanum TaxID=39687 RepID=UPI001CA32467|nr:response regulator transcription factor [Mycolicibacterium austroafricanum]QZT62307.1 response regulator transcription factor [Mycolicibacterium austroafricanum]